MKGNEFSLEVEKKLLDHLSEFVLEKRLELFHSVVKERTRYFTIVLEDIYQSQNASAVIRSCECFGIQDIHIIENINKFSVNPKVSMGAAKWLTMFKYNQKEDNTLLAIDHLRNMGYRIIGTSPNVFNSSIENLNLDKGKFALFFGNEVNGLSETVLQNADELVNIPTVGFTESLNLSVSAAICVEKLTSRLRTSNIDFRLSSQEKDALLLQWLRLTVKSWKSIEKRFLVNPPGQR
jgi:tRNA (guanosine-2'-O-)-methyltransferase